MAEDDIYGSKGKYERFIKNFDKLTKKPKKNGRLKYYCKNSVNLKYFKKLIPSFESKDMSYIRRNRILSILRMITTFTEKDLKKCDRDDVNSVVAQAHKVYVTVDSKKTFIKNLKVIWKTLLPEKDQKGRIDENIMPYEVRHISNRIDKSKQKLRNDRISWNEFKRILRYFSGDTQIQAYLMLAFESLGRPQEILYTKIKDYEFYDNYGKIWISEHGKEGTGFLQCIDSFPYVAQWYKEHPLKDDSEAFFFINLNNRGRYQQLKNDNINHRIKNACKFLGIKKRVTCYSLKRNGITYRRLRGDSDTQIQHAARWTSTKQLKVYDMSTQHDALNIELQKRGMTKEIKEAEKAEAKICMYCGFGNGFTADLCVSCKRPLDRNKIREMAERAERMKENDMIQRFDKIEKLLGKMTF
jgi:integrase